MAVRRFLVPRDVPPRLDAFLRKALPGFSSEQVNALLEQGRVRVNGTRAKVQRRLHGGEQLDVDFPESRRWPRVEGPALDVLASAEHAFIINKPAGLVVEPEPGQASVVELAATQFPDCDVGGERAPGIAHRLDKDTTGCLVLARTDVGLAQLLEAFEAGRVVKTYLAIVEGVPPETASLDTPYGRDPANPRKFSSKVASPRRARLSFVVRERLQGHALLEVALDTGRTHQIRAQLADLGCPLLGDTLYGRASPRAGRAVLHALELRIEGAFPLAARAPIPPEMEAILSELR